MTLTNEQAAVRTLKRVSLEADPHAGHRLRLAVDVLDPAMIEANARLEAFLSWPSTTKRRTHLRHPSHREGHTYCGNWGAGTPMTDDPSEVTCKLCLTTRKRWGASETKAEPDPPAGLEPRRRRETMTDAGKLRAAVAVLRARCCGLATTIAVLEEKAVMMERVAGE